MLKSLLVPLLAGALMAAGEPALAADTERGQLLYENHCTGCHTSRAHIREARKAKDEATLRQQIVRWQTNQKLKWSAIDVDDVYAFLDARYYKLGQAR